MSRFSASRSCRNNEAQHRIPETFEMAYQIRVAIGQIRFAIKSSEQSSHDREVMTEVRMQLLDALQRLETAERHFSHGSRKGVPSEGAHARDSVPQCKTLIE